MTESAERPPPTPQQAQVELEQALFEIRRIIAGLTDATWPLNTWSGNVSITIETGWPSRK